MKTKYLFIIGLIIFLYQGCKDISTENTPETGVIVLNGKIENYSLSGSITLRMDRDYRMDALGRVDSIIVIDSTLVNSTGSFVLTLHTPPDGLQKQRNGLGGAGLIFSNDNIRTYPHSTFRLYKDNKAIGVIYCSNKPSGNGYSVGDFSMYLMYSEAEFSVTGNSGSSNNIYKTNLKLLRGWNVVVQTITEYSDTAMVSNVVVNNKFMGTWFYLPFAP